jgi:hypothetical protein
MPSNISPFSGPRLRILGFDMVTVSSGANMGKPDDFNASIIGLTALAHFHAFGSDPLGGVNLLSAVPGYAATSFYGNGYVNGDNTDVIGGTGPDLSVDGHPAWTATGVGRDYMYVGSNSLPGLPALSLSAIENPDGTAKLVASEGLARCGAGSSLDGFPPTGSTCSALTDSGVAVTVTHTVTQDAHVVRQVEDFTSTDGHAHTLNVDLGQDYYDGVGTVEYQFPGQAGYATHGIGDPVSTAPGPASILGRVAGAIDGAPTRAQEALTYSSTPDSIGFRDPHIFGTVYHRLVPASGVLRLVFIYSTDALNANVRADAAAAEASLHPAAAISSPPADGTTVSTPALAVSGRATDQDGPATLTVNGHAVSVAADGSWSTVIALAPGANTITAAATNLAGVTAQATRSVNYSISPGPTAPALTVLAGVLRANSSGGVDATLECVGQSGQSCNGAIVATIRLNAHGHLASAAHRRKKGSRPSTVLVARTSYSLPAGGKITIHLQLNARGRSLLKRNKRLSLTTTVTQHLASGATQTVAAKRVTVRQPKKHKHH